jgi:hypothetical protein
MPKNEAEPTTKAVDIVRKAYFLRNCPHVTVDVKFHDICGCRLDPEARGNTPCTDEDWACCPFHPRYGQ